MRGSVVKKPNGRYYIVYYVGKKQKWEKVPEPNTKKNASRLLAQRVNEINRGEYREIKKVTFREFADRWLSDYVDDPNHLKASSAYQYHSAFNSHLMPFFGDHDLPNVTADEVQKFIAHLSKAGLAPRTIRNYLAPLKTMLKHAVQWGYLRFSPMPYVEQPRVQHRETAFLPADKIRAFLDHVPEAWYCFFLTAAMTGMRLGELVAMRWDNLDWDGRQYHVRERLYRGLFDTPKSRSSRRAVDLTPETVMALRGHRATQNALKLSWGSRYQDQGLIFSRETGEAIVNAERVRDVLKVALSAAGCPPIRFHDLRHSYASLLIEQDANPKYIQKQLGHGSIQITYDTYGHLIPVAREKVVEELDRQVFGRA